MRRMLPRAWFALILLAAPAFAPADDSSLLLDQPRADYQARRQELMKKIREAEGQRANATRPPSTETLVVLKGEDDRGKQDFEEGRFRQGNYFAYLSGVEVPGAYLVLFPNTNQDVLYLPPKRGESVMNGGPSTPSPGEKASESLGFARVESTGKLLGELFATIGDPMSDPRSRTRSAVVYTISPSPKPEALDLQSRFVRFLKEGAPRPRSRTWPLCSTR